MPRWIERPAPGEAVASFVKEGFDPLFARLLAIRGVEPPGLAAFLSPSLKDLSAPSRLPGIDEAARTVSRHVRGGGKIVVFGDYDCDGVCATAILLKTFAALGANAAPFIPDRMGEGYGMGEASVSRMLAMHPDVKLVVTVDNGIGSAGPVARLEEKGVEVVVTDHHLPGDSIPDCVVVNPKVAAPPDLECLCGAGVAFMLANALVTTAKASGGYSGPGVAGPLVVLAGLATVTDIMPLRFQNRVLVSEALRLFDKYAPQGLKELLSRAARAGATRLKARDFGFLIGPRINATGRMASAMEALDLVMCEDREKARSLAMTVDVRNTERKNAETRMGELAACRLAEGASAQVVSLSEGHQGVAGIVAARILEKISASGQPVPVCVDVRGHGSVRAPDGYNVRDALAAASQWLVSFGGHAAAGGYTVREGCAGRFADAFRAACAAQSAASHGLAGAMPIDAWVDPAAVSLPLVESFSRLEPFGEGNPEPLFASRRVRLSHVRPIGDGRHLRFSIDGGPDAVWWNGGDKIEELRRLSSGGLDIAYSPFVSDYGSEHVEFRMTAARPARDEEADLP